MFIDSTLHQRDLTIHVVLAARAVPINVKIGTKRSRFRAGMFGLPKLMTGAARYNSNAVRATRTAGISTQSEEDEEDKAPLWPTPRLRHACIIS